ncbi:hypothetical protein IGI04_023082 [Brassica rapa subsp. trilocularis]|uniref:Uncharacterized protein n=1 Tax=Brassica rapa subsp. trilocularis TaxID=1813537 RepID=A0ABQ7M678_BRACM|nr:hypothetical protein IGI04_023082 [Brassica rapa subsp. trilocularis]
MLQDPFVAALDEATKGKQYIHSCLSRKQYGEGLKADLKINPADGFIIGSPEKKTEGDDVGMLDGNAAESALPHVEPVSGGVDKREGCRSNKEK